MPHKIADVVVIGAGPAGMSAALAAAGKGLSVMVFDEQAQVGGQIFRQAPKTWQTPQSPAYQFYPFGRQLVANAEAATQIDWRFRRTVWGIFPHAGGGASVCTNRETIEAQTVIIATGAYELPVAFPGWTLPGVMGAGAIQTLVKSQFILPGQRFVLAGSHPLSILVADLLLSAGAEVLEVAIARPRPGFLELLQTLTLVPGNERVFWQTTKAIANIIRHRVPIRFSRRIIAAKGADCLQEVVLSHTDMNWQPVGPATTYRADVLGIGYGLLASSELAQQAGCRSFWSASRGGWIIEQDDAMGTSVPGIYAAGEAAGVGGAIQAAAEGHLAGLAAAAEILPAGSLSSSLSSEIAAARRKLARTRRFSEMFARFFAPHLDALAKAADGDVPVCRCEEISARRLRDLLLENPHIDTVNGVKLACRTGMGLCQGRYCQHMVAHIVAAARGKTIEQCGQFTARAPAKPVRIADLARLD